MEGRRRTPRGHDVRLTPKIAARKETRPGKAEQVVDKVTGLIRSQTSANVPIEKAKDGDTLVVARCCRVVAT